MARIYEIEELKVYQKLCALHIEIDELSLTLPKYELYELGSQVRRSSNAAPAMLAEAWNNKHSKVFLEGISRLLMD